MISNQNHQNMTESFIITQVVGRGLDERTVKAYRMDLERFYLWLETDKTDTNSRKIPDEMEAYLEYLSREKGLRVSTICRKQRVFSSYLAYLVSLGILKQYEPLKSVEQLNLNSEARKEKKIENVFLTKKEIDSFFRAIDREYEELSSDFRRRVCLRDQVMMKLLFYHGIEISELLRLEVADYEQKSAVLTIYRKRGKVRSVKVFSRMLKTQIEEWLEEHAWFEHNEEYQRNMFLSKMGKPLSMKMVINIFDKYRELAGIEKECKPKDLKNSLDRYAKEMVMELG